MLLMLWYWDLRAMFDWDEANVISDTISSGANWLTSTDLFPPI
jgi:hypothetical protein